MKRGAAWLVTVPLALVGVEAAHALANTMVGSPEGAGEVFASAESGEELLPILAAVALGTVLLGLGSRFVGRWSLPRDDRLLALPFACLPLVAFVLLDLIEGGLHRGSVPWDVLIEPAFYLGLSLQVPFALAGYLSARLLLRLTDAVRGLIVRCGSPPAAAPSGAALPCRPHNLPPRPAQRAWAYSGRAPPVGVRFSG